MSSFWLQVQCLFLHAHVIVGPSTCCHGHGVEKPLPQVEPFSLGCPSPRPVTSKSPRMTSTEGRVCGRCQALGAIRRTRTGGEPDRGLQQEAEGPRQKGAQRGRKGTHVASARRSPGCSQVSSKDPVCPVFSFLILESKLRTLCSPGRRLCHQAITFFFFFLEQK